MNFQKRFTLGSDHNIIFCNPHWTHEGKEMQVCMHNTYVFKSCKLKLYFVKAWGGMFAIQLNSSNAFCKSKFDKEKSSIF